MKSIYEQNFELMCGLGIITGTTVKDYSKSCSSGYMDLVVERNPLNDGVSGQPSIAFSLCQSFVMNGDLCSDPLMEILFYPDMKMVEAYTFEMSIPPRYDVVYIDEKVNINLKSELNQYLNQWLKNLKAQGHGVRWLTFHEED